MSHGETASAAVFYGALALFVCGAMRKARAAIERRRASRLDDVLVASGCVGLTVAVVVFATGSHRFLPF